MSRPASIAMVARPAVVLLVVAANTLAGRATAGTPPLVPPPPAMQAGAPAEKPPKRYLANPADLRMAEVLPAAPKVGSAIYEADRQVFRETRKRQGTPRWQLATDDVKDKVPDMLRNFSCAMAVTLDPQRLPRLSALLKRVDNDSEKVTKPVKLANQRQRPFQIDEGAVCQSKLPRSFDFPSGHATWGWSVGLILTELAPDRASEVLLRARAFADSRVVCGVHNLSAIQAGLVNSSAIVARLHAEPAFQADMVLAREELAALRASGMPVSAGQCAAEHALIEQTPY